MTKGPWDSQDAKWKSQVPHRTHGRQLPVEQSLLLYALWSSTGILKAKRELEYSQAITSQVPPFAMFFLQQGSIFLRFPYLSKQAPLFGDQMLTLMNQWGMFYI